MESLASYIAGYKSNICSMMPEDPVTISLVKDDPSLPLLVKDVATKVKEVLKC